MMKSLISLGAFVLLVCLSVLVPAYILATGTATLLPVAQFGAVLTMVAGAGAAAFGAAMIRSAEVGASVEAHSRITAVKSILDGAPMWRQVFAFVRPVLQAVLLLAIGMPVFAAFAASGAVCLLIHKGMLDAYAKRLPKNRTLRSTDTDPKGYPLWAMDEAGQMFINGAFISDLTIGDVKPVVSKRPKPEHFA